MAQQSMLDHLDAEAEEAAAPKQDDGYSEVWNLGEQAAEAARQATQQMDPESALSMAQASIRDAYRAMRSANDFVERTGNLAPLMMVRATLEQVGNLLLTRSDIDEVNALGEGALSSASRIESQVASLRNQPGYFVEGRQ